MHWVKSANSRKRVEQLFFGKRECYSLKSHGKTLLEVSGGGENEEEEEETFVRNVEIGVRKREWESQGDREEERV